jgi:DHA2 family multidrug resistance protein-like MFS transporter
MNSVTIDMSPPKATRREWIGLAVIALPCLLYSMDLNVLNLAIPHITAQLKPSSSQLLWIVDIYGFLLAGFLITMGTLGDRIGRRRLLMMGAAAFGAASILAAFSTTAGMLIFSRAVLGVAAATLAPSTLSLIRNMFLDGRERTVAIGVWISCFSAGSVIGPIVGGVLLEYYWWGSVFLIAVPVMLLLLVLVPLLLPEFKDENAGALDVPSSVLATTTVLAMIYGMKRAAEHGPDVWAALAVCVSMAVGTVFVRRQRQLAEPMIDMRLFQIPMFSAALVVNIIAIFAAFGSFLFVTQYLQLVLGLSPLEAGLWLVPTGLVFIVGAVLAPVIVRHFSARSVLAGGFFVTAVGYGLLTQVRVDSGLEVVLSGLILFCIGLAPMGTLTTDLVMSAAPPEKAGAASGVSETSFEFGAALGVAVLGSIMTAVYRSRMTGANLPGVSPDDLAAASDTLGGAVATAQGIGEQAGSALLRLAQEAFTDSMRVSASVSAVLAVVAAAVCLKFMKGREPVTARTGERRRPGEGEDPVA